MVISQRFAVKDVLCSPSVGFFGKEAIKILLPDKLRLLEKGIRMVDQGSLIDEFVLSMNRAAEKAAPATGDIIKNATSEMSFDDPSYPHRWRYCGNPVLQGTYIRSIDPVLPFGRL